MVMTKDDEKAFGHFLVGSRMLITGIREKDQDAQTDGIKELIKGLDISDPQGATDGRNKTSH